MSNKTVTISFKGFFGKLFCKHKLSQMGDLQIVDPTCQYPIHKYWRFICTKCGKIIKKKQF